MYALNITETTRLFGLLKTKHEVWFSEVSSPWTFYSMTWQKSVEFLQRKVETWHENFVNWTLTTYFVSNSRLTPLLLLDGFTAGTKTCVNYT